MVVVLPAPFTPTTITTAGGSATCGTGRSAASRTSSRCSAISCLISLRVAELFAVDALADVLQNFGGRVHADVGGDQRVLQFLEDIRIDFLAAGDGVFQRSIRPGAGLLDAGLETLQ